jgi:toxin ParE1/3/4
VRLVVWSNDASDDYDAVLAYVANHDGVDRAYAVAARIEKTCDLLGTLATGRMGRIAGTYEKPVGDPYTVAYAINDRPDGAASTACRR